LARVKFAKGTPAILGIFTAPVLQSGAHRGEATKMLPATVLVAYLKNKKYIDERYTHLLPRYDGKYIAVRDGRVVAAAPTIEALRTEFARASITPLDEETAVAFITSDTASMLL
jgi:hypothetical protein